MKMTACLALLGLLWVTPARAAPGDAPSAAAASSSFSPASAERSENHPSERPSFKIPALQFAIGAAAAAISVPLAFWVGSLLGQASPNLIAAGLPSLLVLFLLPPLVIAAAETWLGNGLAPGAYRFWPALAAATLTHALITVVSILLGVNVHDVGAASLLTIVEMLAVPAATTGALAIWRRPGVDSLIGSAPGTVPVCAGRPLIDWGGALPRVATVNVAALSF